ncbi:MAG: hypothetical protein R2724_13655 [Bryobacterales bacterium]
MTRRAFLQSIAASTLPLHRLAAQQRGKVKITDVKVMIVRGTWDWNLVKIETDAGISGIGEAYWGSGVKEFLLKELKAVDRGPGPAQRRQALRPHARAWPGREQSAVSP